MIDGSYRSWDLYTTGQLVDGLQQKKKTGFNLTEMELWNYVVFSRATILSFHPVKNITGISIFFLVNLSFVVTITAYKRSM